MGMEHRKYIINYEMVSWKLMSYSVHMVVHKLVRVKIDPLSKQKVETVNTIIICLSEH